MLKLQLFEALVKVGHVFLDYWMVVPSGDNCCHHCVLYLHDYWYVYCVKYYVDSEIMRGVEYHCFLILKVLVAVVAVADLQGGDHAEMRYFGDHAEVVRYLIDEIGVVDSDDVADDLVADDLVAAYAVVDKVGHPHRTHPEDVGDELQPVADLGQ